MASLYIIHVIKNYPGTKVFWVILHYVNWPWWGSVHFTLAWSDTIIFIQKYL